MRYKKRFRAEHNTELDQYNEAISYIRQKCGGTVPPMKQLKAEKEKLQNLQRKQRKTLSGLERLVRELEIAARNVDAILHPEPVVNRGKQKTRPER